MSKPTEYYTGEPPKQCELCKAAITTVFIDGQVRAMCYSPVNTRYVQRFVWSHVCVECHARTGIGLGSGKGTRYEKTGKNFVKVGG